MTELEPTRRWLVAVLLFVLRTGLRSCCARFPGVTTAVFVALFAVTPASIAGSKDNLTVARQLNEAFVEVAEKISPAVVVITVVQRAPTNSFTGDEKPALQATPDRPSPRRFHRQPRYDDDDPLIGKVSGIIIRENGYIITNGHVVEDAERIDVRLHDGRAFKGTVRGIDSISDVAVIKIETNGLPVAPLADSSKTRVGEFAIAVGSPYSLDYSLTFGHVSAKGRSHIMNGDVSTLDQDFIQTDANINPGNSGGPLVNIEGEVIGINTLIRGLHTGIGFAIPSSLAKEVAEKLISDGKFTRAWLGIGIRGYRTAGYDDEHIEGVEHGVIVQQILPDGPASASELLSMDVIIAVDGKSVTTAQELRGEVRLKPVGKAVTLDVIRKGKALKIQVKPAAYLQSSAT